LAIELSKLNDFEVGIVAAVNLNVPNALNFKRVNNLVEAIEYAEQISATLVFRPTINLDKALTQKLFSSNAELIAWAHVNPSQKTLRILGKARSVKKVVALGGRQYMTWIDNPVARKAIVIKNGQYLPESHGIKYSEPKYVTYLGSIVPQKGFHLLAKIWPEVHKQNPDLRLKVIGSGSLYDPNAQMGKFGIADEQYESLFMNYLGESILSVDFLGKINAEEKNQVVSNSFIGIVNPSGNTENCPASALDFEAYGVPVVSVYKLGLIDTVDNMRTGVLVRNYKRIPKALNELVSNTYFRNELSVNCRNYLSTNFDFSNIVNEWMELFSFKLTAEKYRKVSFCNTCNLKEKTAYILSYVSLPLNRFIFFPSYFEVESLIRKCLRRFKKENK
jgi:glycosyltransferase involved in cell wall biosynthesis